jgi:glyoxylase-like metal-dependent hydrolase (beta-lactamase superfamily II)
VVYLPKEKIAIVGDLVVSPIPYIYDGYSTEWVQTMQNLSRLDADTIVPGHGAIIHDKTYIFLVRDLLKSAVDQMNAELKRTGPAMFQTLDGVKGAVDLTSPQKLIYVSSATSLSPNLAAFVWSKSSCWLRYLCS